MRDTIYAAVQAGGKEPEMEWLRDGNLLTAAVHLRLQLRRRVLGDEAKKQELRDLVARPERRVLDAKLESDRGTLRGGGREMLELNGQDESGLDQLPGPASTPWGCRPTSPPGPRRPRWTIKRATPAPRPPESSTPTSSGALHQGRGRLLRGPRRHRLHERPKAAGKVRIEGKDTPCRTANVVEFRFNV